MDGALACLPSAHSVAPQCLSSEQSAVHYGEPSSVQCVVYCVVYSAEQYVVQCVVETLSQEESDH